MLITDITSYSELNAIVYPSTIFSVSSISSSKDFTISLNNGYSLTTTTSLSVNVTDGGISGYNILSTNTSITLNVLTYTPVTVTNQTAYKYSGN